jgi:hypothetical protein
MPTARDSNNTHNILPIFFGADNSFRTLKTLPRSQQMSSKDDFKDAFPYFESNNFHGWLIQFKSHCRGIGAHLALKPRPVPPVDANGFPLVLNAAQARQLAQLQEIWDEHDHKAFSALMRACIKDPKTKKLTETEDFEHALPLLTRLEERYLSDTDRQKGVAWSQFFNFTASESESGMDLVTRFDGIVRHLQNLGEPVTPAQLYHRFLEASLQSPGSHHQLLATAIYTNPAPLTYVVNLLLP